MVRLKHRYLLINILYPDPRTSQLRPKPGEDVPYTVQFRQPSSDGLTAQKLTRMIRDGVSELFGDYGSGKVAGSLSIKYFSQATSTAIIRVSRDHYRLVWAALTFITRLPQPVNQPCVVQVVRVSGTIRKAEEEAIRRARLSIRRAQAAAKRTSGSALGSAMTTAAVAIAGADDDDDVDMLNGIEDADQPEDADDMNDDD